MISGGAPWKVGTGVAQRTEMQWSAIPPIGTQSSAGSQLAIGMGDIMNLFCSQLLKFLSRSLFLRLYPFCVSPL